MPRQAMKFDDWRAKAAAESPKAEKKTTLRLVEEPGTPKTVEAAEALASQEETTPEEDQAIEAKGNVAEKVPEVGPKVRESKRQAKKELKEAKRKRKVKIKEVIKEEKREEAKEEKVQPEEVKPEEAESQTQERPEGRISEVRELEPEKTEVETGAPEVHKQGQRSELYLNLAVAEKDTPRGWRYESSIRKIKGGLLFDQGGAGSIHVEPRLARTLRKAEKPVMSEPTIEEKAPDSGKREVAAGRHPADETAQEKFQRQIKYLKSGLDENNPDPMALRQITNLEEKLKKLDKEVASQPEPEEKAPEPGEKKTEAAEKKLSPEQIKAKLKELAGHLEDVLLTPEQIALDDPTTMLAEKKKKFWGIYLEEFNNLPEEVYMSEEGEAIEEALKTYGKFLDNATKPIGTVSEEGGLKDFRFEKLKPEDYAYHSKEMLDVISSLKGVPSAKAQAEAPEVLGKEDVIPEVKTSIKEEAPKIPDSFSKESWNLLVTHMNDPEVGKEIWEVLGGMRKLINELKDLEDGLGNVKAYDKGELKAAKERRMVSLKNKLGEKRDELQSFQPKFQELVARCRAIDIAKEQGTEEVVPASESPKAPTEVIESDVKTLRGMGRPGAEALASSGTLRGVAPEVVPVVPEVEPAVPETAPIEKVKTAKVEPKVEPVVKAKEKPPEPVKSKVEARPSPTKIVFEGKTEDLIKGAAKSESEQKKNGLEARLSEIKNLQANEWSETYAEPGGFNQALWEQLSSEKGNESKSEKERFKELRYNFVDYGIKEMETNDNLGKKRRRLANYARELADKSLSEDRKDELQDKVSDLKRREATILLELKGIEDLRKKDEVEEKELLDRAQKRLPSVPKTPDSATAVKKSVMAAAAPGEYEEEENLVSRMYEIDDKIKDIKKEIQSNRRPLRMGIREEGFENTENIEDYMKSHKVISELEEQLTKLEEERRVLMGKGAPAEAEAAKTKNKSTSKAGRIAKKVAIGTGIGAGGLLVAAGAAIARFQYWARWQAPLKMLEFLMKFTGDPGGTFKKGFDYFEKMDPMKLLEKKKAEKTSKE
ncbi:MAG: hypothetical protein PHC53_05160 [Patescibacteria group bacterium]|nr:hypothetical protein [Patescibacteria group bacterium]